MIQINSDRHPGNRPLAIIRDPSPAGAAADRAGDGSRVSLRSPGMTALFVLFFLFFATPAHASTCGSGINFVLVVPTPVVFGNYSGIGLDIQLNGSVLVSCTVVTTDLPSFTISLGAGNNSGGSFSPRKMLQLLGSNTLGYNLYTSNGYGSVWGDGTGGTVTQSYSGSDGLGLKTFTVYGKIPKLQFPPSGAHSDSVTVTISY